MNWQGQKLAKKTEFINKMWGLFIHLFIFVCVNCFYYRPIFKKDTAPKCRIVSRRGKSDYDFYRNSLF